MLRTNVDGKLRLDDQQLLPKLKRQSQESDGHCYQVTGSDCPAHGKRKRPTAGDMRADEWPGLTVMHIVFAREHNRICEDLKNRRDNNGWSDEDLFQNARRILIAEWQNIVYSEYLPVLLGKGGITSFNLDVSKSSTYNKDTDPSIRNSFSTAAFRFGHSLIQGEAKLGTPSQMNHCPSSLNKFPNKYKERM